MTGTPEERDLAPPSPPPHGEYRVPRGFRLGIDLEELYIFFAEGMRAFTIATGQGGELPKQLGAKRDRVRTSLWSLPEGRDLVRRLDDILARTTPGAATPDGVEQAAEDAHLERLFNAYMRTVWEALPEGTAHWYAVGTLLARLYLCLTILDNPPTASTLEFQRIYLKELHRVVPQFAEAFVHLAHQPSADPAPTPLERSLIAFMNDIVAFEDGEPGWTRAARRHADAVFSAIGMAHGVTTPLQVMAEALDAAVGAADEQPGDPAAELWRRHAAYRQALLDREPPEAVAEGLRDLLLTARRALGPRDPLVFVIRSDLGLVLSSLGRMPLGADLALDAADEAAIHLGHHHPITVLVTHIALLFLLTLGRDDEATALFEAGLAPLLAADVDDLPDELRKVRELLVATLGPAHTASAAVNREEESWSSPTTR